MIAINSLQQINCNKIAGLTTNGPMTFEPAPNADLHLSHHFEADQLETQSSKSVGIQAKFLVLIAVVIKIILEMDCN